MQELHGGFSFFRRMFFHRIWFATTEILLAIKYSAFRIGSDRFWKLNSLHGIKSKLFIATENHMNCNMYRKTKLFARIYCYSIQIKTKRIIRMRNKNVLISISRKTINGFFFSATKSLAAHASIPNLRFISNKLKNECINKNIYPQFWWLEYSPY